MTKDEVIELLKPFKDLLENHNNYYLKENLEKVINDLEIKYEIRPKYQTLREYLKENSCGAYHHFIFEIEINWVKTKINVISDDDFERFYNGRFLDMYNVINDEKKSNGNNCENYDCKHYLTLEAIK